MRRSLFQLEEKHKRRMLEARAITTNVAIQQADHNAYTDPNTAMACVQHSQYRHAHHPYSDSNTGVARCPTEVMPTTCQGTDNPVGNEDDFAFPFVESHNFAFPRRDFRTFSKRTKNSSSISAGTLESGGTGARKYSASVQAERSRSLDYSHFISLPLGVHPALVDQLTRFQESVLDLMNPASKEKVGQKNTDAIKDIETMYEVETAKETRVEAVPFENFVEDPEKVSADELEHNREMAFVEHVMEPEARIKNRWGIDRSVFVKPATFHLTVLMLKLWNNDRVTVAAETLQRCKPKVHEALEGRPIAVRVRGLECMRGSPAKAHVLYACVEEADQGNRLARACQVIIDEFVGAGLVLEADSRQALKLHATLMNTRHREMKRGKWFKKWISFDARQILSQHGSIDFGEHFILEAHLSERFSYGENGYYQSSGSIELPTITM